jgi:hypothetical protein
MKATVSLIREPEVGNTSGESISKKSKSARKKLQRLPIIGQIIKVPVKKIKEPPCEDRLNLKEPNNPDYLGKLTLKVLYLRRTDTFYIVEGKCCFREGKGLEIKDFDCYVAGEIQSEDQVIIARADYVLSVWKPFHILEQTLLLLDMKNRVISKHGIKAFYGNGGDRRSAKYKKMNLVEVLKERIPEKKSRIEILLRFGDHLGCVALKALYKVLDGSKKKLTLYKIHQKNPLLGRDGLRKQINDKFEELKAKGVEMAKIEHKLGLIAYDALFRKRKKGKKKRNWKITEIANEDRGAGNPPGKKGPPVYKPIGSKELSSIKRDFDAFIKDALALQRELRPKRKLTAAEFEELDKQVKELESALSEFRLSLMRTNKG